MNRTGKSLIEKLVAVALIALLAAVCGCKTKVVPAAVPSDQRTALIWNAETRDVLMNASDKDIQVLASALEANAEEGSVVYIDHLGWVHGPDGNLFLDAKGMPIKTRTRIIAKLNSLKALTAMEGVEEVEYTVGGFDYVEKLPELLKGKDLCPVALKLKIKGITKLGASSNAAALREAAAKERELIFAGASAVATANGAAFATRVDAVARGVATITTAAGTIVGQVLKTSPMSIPADLISAGVTKMVSAVVKTGDGKLADIVAADTANQQDATTLGVCGAQ